MFAMSKVSSSSRSPSVQWGRCIDWWGRWELNPPHSGDISRLLPLFGILCCALSLKKNEKKVNYLEFFEAAL